MIVVSNERCYGELTRQLLPQREAVLPYGPVNPRAGFYRVDIRLNAVIEQSVDLEQLARELGVLSDSEHITG